MKKIIKYKKTILAFLFLVVAFFVGKDVLAIEQCDLTSNKGQAMDLNRIAECFENRYGYDENYIRRSKKKGMAPTVEIHFDKTDPQQGEEISAIAVGKGFKNTTEDLYYTWYIIRTDPETGEALPGENIAVGKRRAMGIIARGEYDPGLFGEEYDDESDDDGFYASYGGNDGVGAKVGEMLYHWDDDPVIDPDTGFPAVFLDIDKMIIRTSAITRCYRHNFGLKIYDPESEGDDDDRNDERAGRDQIIPCVHEFPSCGPHVLGDGEFGLEEEECWELDPNDPDTDHDGVEDEADLAGLNQQKLVWKYRPGDRIGVVIEGTSMAPINEGGEVIFQEIDGVMARNPEDGAEMFFPSREAAFAFCEGFLSDALEGETEIPDSTSTTTGTVDQTSGDTNLTTTTTGGAVPIDFDLEPINEGARMYDSCVESIEDNWTDEEVIDESGALNAYHKIMWASPDICARHDDSIDFLTGDHCSEGEGDIGFQYLATVPLNPLGSEILDPELDYVPKNPQFDATADTVEDEKTDIITVSAVTNNDNVDEDFLFYNWIVLRCDEFLECEDAPGVVFETYQQGMGVKEIKFRPTEETFIVDGAIQDKVFLEVTVVESQHPNQIGGEDLDTRNFPVGAIESIALPVMRNDVAIRIYEAEFVGGEWQTTEEICTVGNYYDVCPVYSYQVIGIEVDPISGIDAGDRFSWQLNGERIEPPFDGTVYAGANDLNTPLVFMMMEGYERSLQDITVTYKKVAGPITDIIAGRKISLNNPLAVIDPFAGATPTQRHDGADSLSIFEAPGGTAVTFEARLVPDYLEVNTALTMIKEIAGDDLADGEVHLMWYLNGSFVDQDYIADHPSLNVAVDAANNRITFTLPEDMTDNHGYTLSTRVEKVFNSVHLDALDRAWRELGAHSLTNDRGVTVRKTAPAVGAQGNTLREYFASSLANAPEYLIFSIRLGLSLVLMWFLLFGFSYAIRLNQKL